MKRFWTETTAREGDGGWHVLLDGRPVRTPARNACVVPVQALAQEIAVEWDAQTEVVNPLSMPMTRAASTCLDRVVPEIDAVRQNVSSYAETDLICYRAAHPQALAAKQAQRWDPLLHWSAKDLGAPLTTATGVMHVQQSAEHLARLASAVSECGPWTLTALSELVTISGSLVIGLAVQRDAIPAEDGWSLSRIDEDWNIQEWGEDADAAAQTARRRSDFMNAASLLRHLGAPEL